jgi:hypothetical protein
VTEEREGSLTRARLLTAAQTANYLGYKSVDILRRFPVGPVAVGKGRRWDRDHIDRYLDALSGLTNQRSGGPDTEVIDEIDRHFR